MMARGLCRAAAVLLVATAWGRAWPVCLALWGSLGRLSLLLHMALHLTLFGESRKPTSLAVWGITNSYISCCGANPQFFVGGVHRFWTIQLRKLFTQSHSRQPFIVHSHIVSAALEINQIAAGWCRSLFTIILKSATLVRRSHCSANLARSPGLIIVLLREYMKC